MPQFDFFSFSGQNFWLLVSFFVFYFFSVYFYASSLAEVFKMRQKLIALYSTQKPTPSLNIFDCLLIKIFKLEKKLKAKNVFTN